MNRVVVTPSGAVALDARLVRATPTQEQQTQPDEVSAHA
jgi:hypothetical protein